MGKVWSGWVIIWGHNNLCFFREDCLFTKKEIGVYIKKFVNEKGLSVWNANTFESEKVREVISLRRKVRTNFDWHSLVKLYSLIWNFSIVNIELKLCWLESRCFFLIHFAQFTDNSGVDSNQCIVPNCFDTAQEESEKEIRFPPDKLMLKWNKMVRFIKIFIILILGNNFVIMNIFLCYSYKSFQNTKF